NPDRIGDLARGGDLVRRSGQVWRPSGAVTTVQRRTSRRLFQMPLFPEGDGPGNRLPVSPVEERENSSIGPAPARSTRPGRRVDRAGGACTGVSHPFGRAPHCVFLSPYRFNREREAKLDIEKNHYSPDFGTSPEMGVALRGARSGWVNG